MKKVEGHASLMKDVNSGTVVNTNVREIENARARKKAKQERKEQEQKLHDKVDKIADDLDRLQKMFHELLENEYGNSNR